MNTQFTCECGMTFRKVKRWPLHCHCGRHFHQLPADAKAAEPGLIVKFVSLCAEKAKWYAAGKPERSEQQQAECLEACKACPYFDADKTTCRACGCALIAAVKMATKRCPHGKWPDDKPTDTTSPKEA